ncbi:MAG: ribonuclease HII [Alphaproteobacteria bacterium]|nr:ribonuclease HII [Alphaproteobacteria bacterium]
MPDDRLERALSAPVAGIDEAGRGPWAGPVVVAAVVLDPARVPPGLDDSKRLSALRRAALFDALVACATIGVGIAEAAEIDRLNIRRATHLAMRRALEALPIRPRHALVDGNDRPDLPCPATAVVGGDGLSLSIAAASIVAKVTRDRLMEALARAHPGYGFERHKGYGTARHQDALARLGPCAQHRRSFRPVAQAAAISRS